MTAGSASCFRHSSLLSSGGWTRPFSPGQSLQPVVLGVPSGTVLPEQESACPHEAQDDGLLHLE